MSGAARALFTREWRIARRIGGGASVGAVFFLILVTIMPFALGPDLNLLARIGPAILWIAALLATLLGLDRLFREADPAMRAQAAALLRRALETKIQNGAIRLGGACWLYRGAAR